MLENEKKPQELLDTTDSLEAIGAFKAMKNFLFVVALICLVLLQVCFWLLDRKVVIQDLCPEASCAVLATRSAAQSATVPPATKDNIATTVEEASRQVKAQTGAALAHKAQSQAAKPIFYKRFSLWAWLIRFCNFVLIVTAILYCLTILFCLKISLIGRLGGINHICRAFFISLFLLAFLLPWQKLFGGVIAGAIYTPGDLAVASQPRPDRAEVLWAAIYYLRFVVLPVIVLMLLVFAQICTVRWAKATLRRLEVI